MITEKLNMTLRPRLSTTMFVKVAIFDASHLSTFGWRTKRFHRRVKWVDFLSFRKSDRSVIILDAQLCTEELCNPYKKFDRAIRHVLFVDSMLEGTPI
jgi:KaiC/GvpD/RAD55 family RecA-like ATPase